MSEKEHNIYIAIGGFLGIVLGTVSPILGIIIGLTFAVLLPTLAIFDTKK